MYEEVIEALAWAASNPSINVAFLTGAGAYYSSGNDLTNFVKPFSEGPEAAKKMAKTSGDILLRFVNAFIRFPKVLVAAVNGPCLGIAVTTLGLCDIVYAAEKASFHTPFSALGQSPEGCSSYVFPKIMGPAKAHEVLYMGRKLTAQEAYERNLVTAVLPGDAEQFQKEALARTMQLAAFPPQGLVFTKQLIRSQEKATLEQVNLAEVKLLEERWVSPECIAAITNFMKQQQKKRTVKSKL
eukprot:TRINITY_DN749_c0_g1_i2.p1 TRINITY_DN749_c0_g1~~TRINITY_DN749_c0_g1_i2.p1  ORF type:complete len:241 (-),score=76.58 TRINITY_DN749_c0_g1_i2:82-804(-)